MRQRRLIAADLFYPSEANKFAALLKEDEGSQTERLSLPAAILIPQGTLERIQHHVRAAFTQIELSGVRRVLLILPTHGPRLSEHEGFSLFGQQHQIQTAFGPLDTIDVEDPQVLLTDVYSDEEPALEASAALLKHYCSRAKVYPLFYPTVDASTSKMLASRIDSFCDEQTLVLLGGNASGYEVEHEAAEHAARFSQMLHSYKLGADRPALLEEYRAGRLTGTATLGCDALHRSRAAAAAWRVCIEPAQIDPPNEKTVYHLSAVMKLESPRREP